MSAFTGEYFEVAQKIWQEFSPEMAQRTLNELYPHWDISQENLERADRLIEQAQGGLKRLLVENRDVTERALRLRAADAAGEVTEAGKRGEA